MSSNGTWHLLLRRVAAYVVDVALLFAVCAPCSFRPCTAGPSFAFFANVAELPRNSLISLAIVACLGAWFGRGRIRRVATAS